ncbi:hypothetical protein AYI70_g2477 [Smittium culicis]|uniref:Uncharacterized protein n=1 Tax=Smittium culicis TaxID=133412 RepID=A0A1R1Y809_9FUNG|nr:hypothetical protein AYI70_g2477 [Smittium culicis]
MRRNQKFSCEEAEGEMCLMGPFNSSTSLMVERKIFMASLDPEDAFIHTLIHNKCDIIFYSGRKENLTSCAFTCLGYHSLHTL